MRRAGLVLFRRLPLRLRRLLVRAGTPSFTVGAVAVLRRPDGELLLVEQTHSQGWALPGGLLRHGEALQDGLVRELQEETGLRFDPAALPVPLACVNAASRRVDVVFLLETEQVPRPAADSGAEINRIGWFPLGGLPDLGGPTGEILRAVRLR